uniref:CDC42 small effector 2 n=1 Tax=Gallus gallus TaxID=9031 RepID=A0A8V0Y6B0_CHICK
MSEFWLCFNCCIAEQPQPVLRCPSTREEMTSLFRVLLCCIAFVLLCTVAKRRRRIDRNMIGEPTNFVHTAHVGSGDLFSGMNSVSSIQNQMQSKGGYGGGLSANVQMQLVDTKAG